MKRRQKEQAPLVDRAEGQKPGGGVPLGGLSGPVSTAQDVRYPHQNKGPRIHPGPPCPITPAALLATIYAELQRRCQCLTCGHMKGKRVEGGYLLECGPMDWWKLYQGSTGLDLVVAESVAKRRVMGCRLYDGEED